MSNKNSTTVFVDPNWREFIELRDAKQKEKAIAAELAEVHRQIESTQEEKRALFSNPREAEIGALADDYLAGRKTRALSIDARLSELYQRRDVLELALTKQQAITADARGRFSKVVCADPRNVELYLQIEQRQACALTELAEAGDAERAFLQDFYDRGCSSVNFRPMRLKQLGSMQDPNSLVRLTLAEYQKYLPEVLK